MNAQKIRSRWQNIATAVYGVGSSFSSTLKRLTCLSLTMLALNGCIAKSDIILPTTYERQMLQDQYRQCITLSTNKIYDNTTPADEIVRASFGNCRGARQAMLQSYPRRWHEHMAGKLDDEIYQKELAWILDRRK